MRGSLQEWSGFPRFKNLRTDEGAVDEQCELTGKFVRAASAQPLGDPFQATPQFALVRGRDPAGGVVGFRELRGNVDLRAAAIVRPPDPLADPFQVRVEFGFGIIHVLFGHAAPRAPEILVLAGEKGGDEVVLRAEMAIETGLGDPCLGDHEVNTHGAHAALVEEGRGGFEDPVPHVDSIVVIRFGRAFRHPSPPESGI